MSPTAAKTVAQSKLNLFLHVLGREPSGFHSIETLFLRTDLGDDVTVRVTDLGRALKCDLLPDLDPGENLAFRAAEAYSDAAGWPRGFEIGIGKRIPVGAGLGGGSADAAAVLRILNRLNPEPLPDATLFSIGSRLGSDIPFLLGGAAMALAWGRGERMLALDPLPRKPVLIAAPDFSVSTADAYAALDKSGLRAREARSIARGELGSWKEVAALSYNSFEDVIAAEHPEISRLVSTFRLAGAQISGMTGTGSAVFAIFDEMPIALPMVGPRVTLHTTRTSASVVPITVLG